MTAIVHYVKHWDNDTKGTVEFDGGDTLATAILRATTQLIADAMEDGVDGESDPAALFTITKAELAQGSNWTGAPKAAF
jgi:hypothetical protein